MKLRLHGTLTECAAGAERLRRTPGRHVQDESRPYPHCNGELIHLYLTLTVDLDPTSNHQPGGGGGGRRR
jgi:hypothetical protein